MTNAFLVGEPTEGGELNDEGVLEAKNREDRGTGGSPRRPREVWLRARTGFQPRGLSDVEVMPTIKRRGVHESEQSAACEVTKKMEATKDSEVHRRCVHNRVTLCILIQIRVQIVLLLAL